MHFRSLGILIVATLPLAACTYDEGPDPSKRFLALGIDTPEKNKVEVCHAYGCKMKTEYRFTSKNIASIRGEMAKVKRNGSPAEERRAIAYAIGLMERQVGAAIGIRDVAGMQWLASGDPTQEDCVDESTSTTSYLMVPPGQRIVALLHRRGPVGRRQHALGHAHGKAS